MLKISNVKLKNDSLTKLLLPIIHTIHCNHSIHYNTITFSFISPNISQSRVNTRKKIKEGTTLQSIRAGCRVKKIPCKFVEQRLRFPSNQIAGLAFEPNAASNKTQGYNSVLFQWRKEIDSGDPRFEFHFYISAHSR